MKKTLFLVGILAMTAVLAGCGGNGGTTGGGNGNISVDTDICKEFSADFVYSAIGKPIVRVEASPLAGIFRCQYFVNYKTDYYKMPDGSAKPGGQYVSIQLENALSPENQKKGMEVLGRILSKDPSIKMDHFIATQEDGNINVIDLVLSPMSFITVGRSDTKVITNQEDIAFAAKVAEKLNGKLSFKLIKNPVDTTTDEEKAFAAEPSHEQIVKDFFAFLADKNTDGALAMMDANEDTKQMRGVNFNTIKSLKVTKVAPIYEDERTSTRQVFKVDLNVNVTSEGEQYGWNQGANTRRVSISKGDGNRVIHELANNP